ncbi:hypothetical protein NP118_23445 [Salmonella enterica]|nr:hypothetical protein [Salmonella enterica]
MLKPYLLATAGKHVSLHLLDQIFVACILLSFFVFSVKTPLAPSMAKTRARKERESEEEEIPVTPEVQKGKTRKKRTPEEKEAKRRRRQQRVEEQERAREEEVVAEEEEDPKESDKPNQEEDGQEVATIEEAREEIQTKQSEVMQTEAVEEEDREPVQEARVEVIIPEPPKRRRIKRKAGRIPVIRTDTPSPPSSDSEREKAEQEEREKKEAEERRREEAEKQAEEEQLLKRREEKGKKIAEASEEHDEIAERQVPYDRFVNNFARAKYTELLKRDFLFERGFSGDLPPFLRTDIADHGWELFCAKPEAVNAQVVREFYANIDKEEGFLVIVRGVEIDWSPSAINALYHLQNFPHAAFNEMTVAPSEEQLSNAVREVGIEGAQWQLSKTQKRTFQSAYLNKEANTWMGFIRQRLLPTTHDSTVSRERILLAFAILRSLSIDVGKIICNEIACCWKKKVGKLFFPNTITMLCRQAGVLVDESDMILFDKGIIDTPNLARL